MPNWQHCRDFSQVCQKTVIPGRAERREPKIR
jgi:hypothetical protein